MKISVKKRLWLASQFLSAFSFKGGEEWNLGVGKVGEIAWIKKGNSGTKSREAAFVKETTWIHRSAGYMCHAFFSLV